jgi:hypothetical protein
MVGLHLEGRILRGVCSKLGFYTKMFRFNSFPARSVLKAKQQNAVSLASERWSGKGERLGGM